MHPLRPVQFDIPNQSAAPAVAWRDELEGRAATATTVRPGQTAHHVFLDTTIDPAPERVPVAVRPDPDARVAVAVVPIILGTWLLAGLVAYALTV